MLKFRTHGKWILAGEHSVLRGGSALVFPVKSRYLDFEFEKIGNSLELQIEHEANDLEKAFWDVFNKALENAGAKKSQFSGRLKLSSNIPIGAGMGASAVLCVSLAKWFSSLELIDEKDNYEFAKNLENLFHGESSGVDVAVALNNQALEFKKPNIMNVLNPEWHPHFYLSYCGKKGITSDCVQSVQRLIKTDELLGTKIDTQMDKAVELAKKALMDLSQKNLLVQSIDLACNCFAKWGLISPELSEHMSWLKTQGAIAVKPTGSGGGGFVLSLWEEEKAPQALAELIKA